MIFADEAFKKAALAALDVDEIVNEEQLAEIDAPEVVEAHNLNDCRTFLL